MTAEPQISSLPRDERLAGRTVIVTGSSSCIGEAIARVLAASGTHVVVHGRDSDRAARVARAIDADGGRASVVLGDLAIGPDAARDFPARATDALGGTVDILVNNAGVFPVGPTPDLADADVAALLATNIRVPHDLVGALAPGMVDRGSGVVINITSWMANMGTPGVALYPATKSALLHLTKAWAAGFGPRGVRVNAVAPGATMSPGNDSSREIIEAMTKNTPAGAPGRPIDIAHAVRFLASDVATYVHGIVLDVDGGGSSRRGWRGDRAAGCGSSSQSASGGRSCAVRLRSPGPRAPHDGPVPSTGSGTSARRWLSPSKPPDTAERRARERRRRPSLPGTDASARISRP